MQIKKLNFRLNFNSSLFSWMWSSVDDVLTKFLWGKNTCEWISKQPQKKPVNENIAELFCKKKKLNRMKQSRISTKSSIQIYFPL